VCQLHGACGSQQRAQATASACRLLLTNLGACVQAADTCVRFASVLESINLMQRCVLVCASAMGSRLHLLQVGGNVLRHPQRCTLRRSVFLCIACCCYN
jgi:hypothetical protein